jgi:hypothetical protein
MPITKNKVLEADILISSLRKLKVNILQAIDLTSKALSISEKETDFGFCNYFGETCCVQRLDRIKA